MSKTIIITGANGSTGLLPAKYLFDKVFTIIMACREVSEELVNRQ